MYTHRVWVPLLLCSTTSRTPYSPMRWRRRPMFGVDFVMGKQAPPHLR